MRYSKERLEKLVNDSSNFSEVTRKLGLIPYYGNRQTVKKYIESFNIDITHFRLVSNGKTVKSYSLDDILIYQSKYRDNTGLKNKLYKSGLKKRECELCGQTEEWKGKKISLILDHKNGINNDNRLENLRIVCPNCNATLDTHGGKNKGSIQHSIKPKNKCQCGAEITNKANKCKNCCPYQQRKTDRPSYEILLVDVEENGYSATGRKYGVSDNTIRKWLKIKMVKPSEVSLPTEKRSQAILHNKRWQSDGV